VEAAIQAREKRVTKSAAKQNCSTHSRTCFG
jgi:hypothetical protein